MAHEANGSPKAHQLEKNKLMVIIVIEISKDATKTIRVFILKKELRKATYWNVAC